MDLERLEIGEIVSEERPSGGSTVSRRVFLRCIGYFGFKPLFRFAGPDNLSIAPTPTPVNDRFGGVGGATYRITRGAQIVFGNLFRGRESESDRLINDPFYVIFLEPLDYFARQFGCRKNLTVDVRSLPNGVLVTGANGFITYDPKQIQEYLKTLPPTQRPYGALNQMTLYAIISACVEIEQGQRAILFNLLNIGGDTIKDGAIIPNKGLIIFIQGKSGKSGEHVVFEFKALHEAVGIVLVRERYGKSTNPINPRMYQGAYRLADLLKTLIEMKYISLEELIVYHRFGALKEMVGKIVGKQKPEAEDFSVLVSVMLRVANGTMDVNKGIEEIREHILKIRRK